MQEPETMPSILQLSWSASLSPISNPALPGDKILLPASALEQLLLARQTSTVAPSHPYRNRLAYQPHQRQRQRPGQLDPRDAAQLEEELRRGPDEEAAQLPQPLTFRLVNPANGRVVYAGVREFSAGEGEVALSRGLGAALGLAKDPNKENGDATGGADQSPNITVVAKQLPKGTFVKLRPLEAGYDADDWKALLEEHLRANYTTLTKGEVLTVADDGSPGSSQAAGTFKFLVDEFRPEGDGVCIVDTDLEVDIEALSEEQARETVRRIAERRQKAPGTAQGSSPGGAVELLAPVEGQVRGGEYVDYELSAWSRAEGLEVSLAGPGGARADEGEEELDLFVTPFGARQRAWPRGDQYVFCAVDGPYPRSVRILPGDENMESAETVRISVRSYLPSDSTASPDTTKYRLTVRPIDPSPAGAAEADEEMHDADDVRCGNCRQWVPQRSLPLHTTFCERNNVRCPHPDCHGRVFQRRSPAWRDHWHCAFADGGRGDSAASRAKHDAHFHADGDAACPACGQRLKSAAPAALAAHRVSTCPAKLILCRFCHLQVPQGGGIDAAADAVAALAGLTPHEQADGARTADCRVCGRPVRLRDAPAHARHHEMDKKRRAPPVPCANAMCGATLHGTGARGATRLRAAESGNDVGLCAACFGPLHAESANGDARALRRRVERRYLTQFTTGCGRAWCHNERCRAGRRNRGLPEAGVTVKAALVEVRPLLEALDEGKMWFCVDEKSQAAREAAERIADEGEFAVEWCVGAVEAAGGDVKAARQWLRDWAPTRSVTLE